MGNLDKRKGNEKPVWQWMRGRGLRLGYEQAPHGCDSWAAAFGGERRTVPRLKVPGIIPLLPLAGLMHLVVRKEKKTCLGEMVPALGKSERGGSRRLGKTKTWEKVRLWI